MLLILWFELEKLAPVIMFGKGTFKSYGSFRPNVSTAASPSTGLLFGDKINSFNEAEKAHDLNEGPKAIELYKKFLSEAENSNEGTT